MGSTDRGAIPYEICYSLHTSRNKGRRTSSSVTFHAGGIFVGWLHPFEAGAQERVVAYARTNGRRVNGSSRHETWRIEDGDAACLALYGTNVLGEIARHLPGESSSGSPVLFAPSRPGYVLGENNLLRFYHSRCRDRTWCRAIRLREVNANAREYLLGMAGAEGEVSGLLFRRMAVPPPAPRQRQLWRCADCSREGLIDAFRIRDDEFGGQAIDCPVCEPKDFGAVSILVGKPRGRVERAESGVILPGW